MPASSATSPHEIFQQYIMATMARDAGGVAELFAPEGVYEAPLMPEGQSFPRQMRGRAEIQTGLAEFYRQRPQTNGDRTVDLEKTRFELHQTSDPDVFIAEIDTVFHGPGDGSTVSLVQIFRVRAGQITLLRDYFAPQVLS